MMQVISLSLEQILPFIEAVVKQHEPPLSLVDTARVAEGWRNFISVGTGVAFGVERSGNPAGFLLGLNIIDLISGQRQMVEYLWMVAPEHRRGGTARALWDRLELEARAAGCKRVIAGCHEVFEAKKMGRFYQRLGCKPFSQAFSKELM